MIEQKILIQNSIVFLVFFVFSNGYSQKGIPSLHSLTVSEGFTNPIGFYNDKPSFSWKLPVVEQIKSQSAYTIVVASDPSLLPNNPDLWDSGKVDSDQSVWIKYAGKKIESRKKVYWQVKYWDQNKNASQWSAIANFELGLLNNSDWSAKWINLPDEQNIKVAKIDRTIHSPQYFRKDFQVNSKIKKARLYITAKGIFEAQINGHKIGNDVMTPGWTPYKKRIETLTYDVTDLLNKGQNTIGVILAEGWYSGIISSKLNSNFPPKIIAQLEVYDETGIITKIISDESWKATREGSIVYSGIYDGEFYDANKEIQNWSKPKFEDTKWDFVQSEKIDSTIQLAPKSHQTVVNKLEILPITISKPNEKSLIFDLGQNMVGVSKLKIPVIKGDTIKIRFAEMLQDNGQLYTANYRTAVSTDFYVASKDGVIDWQPKFTFHGFRYVELTGYNMAKKPNKSWVKGIVQHSDFELNGAFTSSHKKLNQLQSNITWGLRGNFFDIPTDCPQRNERLGWTGDAQIFAPTSFYIADVHSFWSSWLQSVREEQFENGGIPFVVPNILGQKYSAGWGDAAVIIPWETYLRTGDKKVLKDNYEMMKKWVDLYTSLSANNLVSFNIFGDWLQPFSAHGRKGDTPMGLICTAYYARSIQLTMESAKVLDNETDTAKYKTLLDAVKKAFEKEYFAEDGKIKNDGETQTGYLLAIGFDLLSKDMSQKAAPNLINLINKSDNHLGTGFLGTPLLAPVLDKIGQIDLMYKILFNETYPSWFYSINQGATTMWERWNSYSKENGFGDVAMNSFNHYAYGAIGQWMYEGIAGITPLEVGYKKIGIRPQPGGSLTSAKGAYDSPYGKIVSDWIIKENKFYYDVVIPPNTTAQIIILSGKKDKLMMNGKEIIGSSDVKIVERNDVNIILEVVPGSYSFINNVNN